MEHSLGSGKTVFRSKLEELCQEIESGAQETTQSYVDVDKGHSPIGSIILGLVLRKIQYLQ